MGQMLKELRIEQDITQAELARVIGYRNQSNVSQIERGGKGMPNSKLIKAARYLGVRPEALAGVTK